MTGIPRHIALLLCVFSLLLASTPVEGLSALAPASAEDACCDARPAEDATDQTSADGRTSDDGCCPSDCHGCFLKCCVGFLSLRPARVTMLPAGASRAAALETSRTPTTPPRGAIERPPRR